ncbi:hypothetical protein P7K49_024793 [Saguinus oedipus]|uniref:N-terminal Ras-GEF domain-containing protein n=1 Tax=Saguinus oedipus TaxID=9490 RepID=A0ABQ9UQK7_SAGOE|nr:hypothetical protein P7K49_024793 [Saguinus oedipus]
MAALPAPPHSDAFLEGYVQQFLYTFRYFCTPHDFLHFLLDRINSTLSRAHQDPTSTFAKIYRRSLCVLQAWVEDCYTVDFTRNSGLLGQLEDFISSKILPLDGSAEHLLGLLEVGTDRRAEGSPRGTDLENPKEADEDTRPFNALCKRLSEDGLSRKGPLSARPALQSFPWRLPRGNGLVLPPHKERPYTIAAALPKPCFLEDFYGPCAKTSEKGPYFLTEYSTHQLFSQLTLLQQVRRVGIHTRSPTPGTLGAHRALSGHFPEEQTGRSGQLLPQQEAPAGAWSQQSRVLLSRQHCLQGPGLPLPSTLASQALEDDLRAIWGAKSLPPAPPRELGQPGSLCPHPAARVLPNFLHLHQSQPSGSPFPGPAILDHTAGDSSDAKLVIPPAVTGAAWTLGALRPENMGRPLWPTSVDCWLGIEPGIAEMAPTKPPPSLGPGLGHEALKAGNLNLFSPRPGRSCSKSATRSTS